MEFIRDNGLAEIDVGSHFIVCIGGAMILGVTLGNIPGLIIGAVLGAVLGYVTKKK